MRRAALLVFAIALVIGLYLASHRRRLSQPYLPSRIGSGGALAMPQPAPDFTLEALDGQSLALANSRGKVVLLDFWATWCDPCREETPHFVELQNKYRDQGLQIIGISMDDGPKPVREFYQQFKLNYPVAMGTEELAQSYGGILGLPVTFLIGRDGRIAAKYVGAADMPALEREINSLLASR